MTETRFVTLSVARRQLVELMRRVQHGRIEGFDIKGGEPLLTPQPRLVYDLMIHERSPHPAKKPTRDFALKEEVVRLFDLLTMVRNGRVERLEVRSGLPHRVHLEEREVA